MSRVDDEQHATDAGEYADFDYVNIRPHSADYVVLETGKNKTLKDVVLPFGSFAMIWWGFLGLHLVVCFDALYFQIVEKILKLELVFGDWPSLSI